MIASRIAARAGLASIVVGLLSSVLLLIPASAASTSVSIVAMGTNGCSSTYCYQPGSVTINGGDSVNWTDHTADRHTATRRGAAPGENDSACPPLGAAGNNGPSSGQLDGPPR